MTEGQNHIIIIDSFNEIQQDSSLKIISVEEMDSGEKSTQDNNQPKNLVKLSKKIGKQKENFVKKQLEVKLVPSFYHLNEIESLFLVGEVFIIFDFDNKYFEKTNISSLNNFKRIQHTAINNNNRFLQIQLEYKVPTVKYFYHSAQKLMNYPKQDIHDLGILLQLYQQFCFECYEFIKSIESVNDSYEQFILKRNKFNEQKQKYFDSFKQDEFIYSFHLCQNLKTKEFEMESIYVSEPFLILMGTTLEQYERYLHRYGLNEFLDSKSQLALTIFQLKQTLRGQRKFTNDYPLLRDFNENEDIFVTLYTFDGIQIQAKVVSEMVLPKVEEYQQINVPLLPDMLMVIKYEIEPTSLQQLISIRQNQQNNQLSVYDKPYLNEIDYSLDYQLQSEIFYEMAKLHNIYSKTKKRALFRYLNQQEISNLKQFNVARPNDKF